MEVCVVALLHSLMCNKADHMMGFLKFASCSLSINPSKPFRHQQYWEFKTLHPASSNWFYRVTLCNFELWVGHTPPNISLVLVKPDHILRRRWSHSYLWPGGCTGRRASPRCILVLPDTRPCRLSGSTAVCRLCPKSRGVWEEEDRSLKIFKEITSPTTCGSNWDIGRPDNLNEAEQRRLEALKAPTSKFSI